MTTSCRYLRLQRRARYRSTFVRSLRLEPLEDRALLSVLFQDINPNNSDGDAADPDRSSMGRVNGLASVGRQDLGTADNNTFYAATEWGGLYKTTDNGVNWFHLDTHLPTATFDVEVDPANTNRVYATSFFDGKVASLAGINISTDAGAHWVHPLTADPNPAFEGTANDNTPQAGYACSNPRDEISAAGIAIQPDAPQNVFVATTCGLARSTNNGLTWQYIIPDTTPATPPPSATQLWGVVAQAGGIVDVVGVSGHFRSTDGGNTWLAGDTLPAAGFNGVTALAASPDENYVLFVAGADNQVYETDNGGTNWKALGDADPVNGDGRLQFITTNQRTTGFDMWTGGVTLYRVACTTPAMPAPGNVNTAGTQRCPQGANPTSPPAPPTPVPANWFGGFSRSGLGGATGAHDDVGDVVFDTAAANDAIPKQYASDGGVYRYTSANASPMVPGDVSWEQPTVGPHATWVFGMTGVNIAGNTDNEHLYFVMQDNGIMGSTNAGAATPTWHNEQCCDGFDVAADPNRVIYTRGAFGPPGPQTALFRAGPGMTGPGETSQPAPPNGLVTAFNFSESIDTWADKQYAILTRDCTVISGMPPTGTQGCIAPNTGDGGVFFTNDITAANPWTELVEPAGMNSAQLEEVQVAVSGGTQTFYVQVGGGDRAGGDQLWKRVGTANPGTSANWTRIDNNTLIGTPNAPMAGGIGFFSVDPNNPNFLYA